MIRIQRILFPTDFSENSKHPEEYACEFANQFHSELHILHILQDLALMAPPPLFTAPKFSFDQIRAESEQTLATIPPASQIKGLSIVRQTCVGTPFLEIVRYARANNIDLIILGTHGRTGLRHVFMGSVAENVVRHANCPVLTVRPTGHHFVMP